MYRILYNPQAGNGKGREETEKLVARMVGEKTELVDMTTLGSYADFFAACAPDDRILITGGDGTLNRFLNDTAGFAYRNPIYIITPSGAATIFGATSPRRGRICPFASTAILSIFRRWR